jgi:glutathione synthase
VPRGNDLRANISAGGKPVEAQIGETEFKIAEALKERLVQDGMFFVGIDVIGDKVVEINAESPGGLQSVEHFTGIDFGLTICEALERRVLDAGR